jgi:hypothetical protein
VAPWRQRMAGVLGALLRHRGSFWNSFGRVTRF